MFTGLVERVGRLLERTTQSSGITSFLVEVGSDFSTSLGDSVALDGCCLTVTKNSETTLSFDLSQETLKVTTLGALQNGALLNLERALKVGDRLGGHFVTGHVDGVSEVVEWQPVGDGAVKMVVALPAAERGLVVQKGSICLAGVSLTINAVKDNSSEVLVELMLIPHTLKATHFHQLTQGAKLNYETDMLGKYLQRARTAYTC